ncbi:hypothetical protein BpHYR1_008672 [Brachionus plicatilis]|uniref:Uncharacterized protein n=1 Tax=Brachionus plicatilis TaxID=10195 RepID=A0A3M7QH63_BRAPC|nr:hypothetical protein BpHYR1_008672 [Brachionus plicatilis]
MKSPTDSYHKNCWLTHLILPEFGQPQGYGQKDINFKFDIHSIKLFNLANLNILNHAKHFVGFERKIKKFQNDF